MKASDLVTQLANTLPSLTGLFSDELTVTSLTYAAGLVTVVTEDDHLLTTGRIVTIQGAIAPIEVTELTSSTSTDKYGNPVYIASGLVDGGVGQGHDLTQNYQSTVLITGADQTQYNGTELPLLTVPNRYQFTYQLPASAVSPATGSPILLWDGAQRGYNGTFEITVIDANTFTYPITTTPYSPALGTIKLVTKIRISAVSHSDLIQRAYTAQPDGALWAFVVLGDTDISKDRENYNDATATIVPGQKIRQIEIQTPKVYVVVPTTNEIASRGARDLMEDVRVFLYKCIMRLYIPSGLTDPSQCLIAAAGHRTFAVDGAYYMHEFNFQVINYISYDDTIAPSTNVAFRNIELTDYNNPNEPVDLGVNLDDEPYSP